jgi:hypothetical protein
VSGRLMCTVMKKGWSRHEHGGGQEGEEGMRLVWLRRLTHSSVCSMLTPRCETSIYTYSSCKISHIYVQVSNTVRRMHPNAYKYHPFILPPKLLNSNPNLDPPSNLLRTHIPHIPIHPIRPANNNTNLPLRIPNPPAHDPAHIRPSRNPRRFRHHQLQARINQLPQPLVGNPALVGDGVDDPQHLHPLLCPPVEEEGLGQGVDDGYPAPAGDEDGCVDGADHGEGCG